MITIRYRLLISLIIIIQFPFEVLSQIKTVEVNLEVITTNALSGGDGGNQWGGHQCRVVQTKDGVFTAYTSGDEDHFKREWHLMKRTVTGWQEIATDKSGREPVNLMAGPDGNLYIIGWPKYEGTIWSGIPGENGIEFKKEKIPAVYSGSHPYNAAGIDGAGNICVITSVDDNEEGGRFQWAYYNAIKQEWQGRITFLDYRHCYTYIFPHPDRSISLVSTRDVRWQTLGYEQPPNTFAYVFNAFRYWNAQSIDHPLQELAFVEEKPTPEFPFVICRAMNDVYLDHENNMHILYSRQGKSTNGQFLRFHSIFSQKGKLLFDARLALKKGKFCRIFQDEDHRYYILDDTGILYQLDDAGKSLRDSVQINLEKFPVNYAGYGLSVPRTGSIISNTMNIVYPSRNGKYYIYFQLQSDSLFPTN